MSKASRLLTAFLLSLLLAAPLRAADQVILVRHAEKRVDAGADPALSPAGEARAAALAEALSGAGVSAILITPFRRTRDTAAPLAARLGIEPVVVGVEGGLDAHAAAVAKAAREVPGVVLVVGHSNTVPAIIGALGGPALPDLCESSYAHAFVLSEADGAPRLQRWRYGAPHPEPDAECL